MKVSKTAANVKKWLLSQNILGTVQLCGSPGSWNNPHLKNEVPDSYPQKVIMVKFVQPSEKKIISTHIKSQTLTRNSNKLKTSVRES